MKQVYVVSVAGHNPHYFATQEAAEAGLRSQGARHDERIGWYTVDEEGEQATFYRLSVEPVLEGD